VSDSRTNGASYRPVDYDPTRPGGPVDMRDIHRLRNGIADEFERVHAKLDTLAEAGERTLTISAATYEAVTGKGVESIPGIGEFARREHRRQTAIRWAAAALAVLTLSVLGGAIGHRVDAAITTTERR
jgi:hypothetical protein